MSLPARPRMRKAVILRWVEDEVVAYDPVSDRTCLLNLSAAAVLEQCDGTRGVAEIAGEIERVFSIPSETATSDVRRALAEFARVGLLERSPPAGE